MVKITFILFWLYQQYAPFQCQSLFQTEYSTLEKAQQEWQRYFYLSLCVQPFICLKMWNVKANSGLSIFIT